MKNRLTEQELEKINVERYVEGLFTRDECRMALLNAARYLEKNECLAKCSKSALDIIIPIVLAFAAGELDWVKDIGREEERLN